MRDVETETDKDNQFINDELKKIIAEIIILIKTLRD